MAKQMSSADFELCWALCPDKLLHIGTNPFSKRKNCAKRMSRSILVDGVSITKTANLNWLGSCQIRRLKELVGNLSEQVLVRVGCTSWTWEEGGCLA